jgi:hypothetical protein
MTEELKIAFADLAEEILYAKYLLLGHIDTKLYERWLEAERRIGEK